MTSTNQRTKFTTILILIAIQSIVVASFVAASSTPPLTKCNIGVDDPHISKSLLRTRGILAVKVNARSKCNKSMSNLILTVAIYKIGFWRNQKVASEDIKMTGEIAPNKVIRNKETFAECKNSRESRFYGVAYATALVEGERMRTLHVTTERTLALPCGT